MLQDYTAQIKEEKPSGLKKLRIDEIALLKGQEYYCAVLIDFNGKITNGVVEGINNKIRLIKRSAYEFRNFDNFRVEFY